MHDLDERMRIADEIDPPDLWSTIETRANRREVVSHERDPLGGGRKRVVAAVTAFVVFAIVATFSWQVPRSGRPAATSALPPNPPNQLSTYTDKLGWKIDYPPDWRVTRFTVTDNSGGLPVRGAAFSNVPLAKNADGFPYVPIDEFNRYAALIVRSGGGVMPSVDPHPHDSSFPLSPSEAKVIPGASLLYAIMSFQGNARSYTALLGVGRNATPADKSALGASIRSIRFPAIPTTQSSNGWTAVGSILDYPAGKGTPGGGPETTYVMRSTSGFNYLFVLPPNGCPQPEGKDETWDQKRLEIWIRCPSPPDVRYSIVGAPLASNPRGFRKSLPAHPIVIAWDGQLLTRFSETIGVPPNAWHG
jgi:hypothetical protein